MDESAATASPLALATQLTVAWLANPNTKAAAEDVPAFLKSIHATVAAIAGGQTSASIDDEATVYEPAITVRKSLASKDHIISLIDGKPYRTLKRHLSGHGLSPDEYRERYGLKSDYPMVAESYSQARRDMAKRIGLGRKPAQPVIKPKATRGRPKKVTP